MVMLWIVRVYVSGLQACWKVTLEGCGMMHCVRGFEYLRDLMARIVEFVGLAKVAFLF